MEKSPIKVKHITASDERVFEDRLNEFLNSGEILWEGRGIWKTEYAAASYTACGGCIGTEYCEVIWYEPRKVPAQTGGTNSA